MKALRKSTFKNPTGDMEGRFGLLIDRSLFLLILFAVPFVVALATFILVLEYLVSCIVGFARRIWLKMMVKSDDLEGILYPF